MDFLRMYPSTLEPHRGIEASLSDAVNVIHLYLAAREADDYFDWSASAARRLKEQFPNLKKVIIEDDYLPQKPIDELPGYLAPVVVEWVQRHYIDGRNGR